MVAKIRIILDLLLSPYTYCVGSLTPTKRLSYPSYPMPPERLSPLFAEHIGGVAQRDKGVDTVSLTTRHRQDCLPLFAEHIGGVAQRDEGVDTPSPTPPSLRDTSLINSAKAP